MANHFVAVSTNAERVSAFGIDTANMFGFWDWVGGRYSMDSAIGLSTMIALGADQFDEMLAGFHDMDQHFRTAPLALEPAGADGHCWRSGTGTSSASQTVGVMPYEQYLKRFPAYLQQLTMESNGKHVTLTGQARRLRHRGGLLGRARHQRAALVLPAHPPGDGADPGRPDRVRADAQPARRPPRPALVERVRAGRRRSPSARPRSRCAPRAPPRPWCRTGSWRATGPTNTLLCDILTPRLLGTLVALYEHSVFVQGVIWDIDSFDQWGVELGKQLAQRIIPELTSAAEPELNA